MATYWCTEVIPLAVTALLPALLFPLLKVLDSKQVSDPEDPGGFLLLPWAPSQSLALSSIGPRGPEKLLWILFGMETFHLTLHPTPN